MKLQHTNIFNIILEKRIKGIPLNKIVTFFIRGILNGSINTRATSISFHFFMAMLPAIVFFFTLTPHIPLSGIDDASISILSDLLPEKTSYSIVALVTSFVSKSGKIPIFSILIAFMFAMNGVNGVISAFNSSFHTIETRSWMQKRKISVVLVGILFILFVTAACFIVFSKYLILFLIEHEVVNKVFTVLMLQIGKWIVIYLLILMTISFTYYLAPANKRDWKFISAGSLMASALTVIASLIFTYIMNKFGRFNLLFGPAGTVMVILLWIYFNALALLLGFELNACINNVTHHE